MNYQTLSWIVLALAAGALILTVVRPRSFPAWTRYLYAGLGCGAVASLLPRGLARFGIVFSALEILLVIIAAYLMFRDRKRNAQT